MDGGESRVLVVSAHFGCRCRDIMTNSLLKRAVQLLPLVFSQKSKVSFSFWDKVGLHVLSPAKSGCGRAVKKEREMTRVKQPGSKLGEASCTTQEEKINILDKGISASIERKPSASAHLYKVSQKLIDLKKCNLSLTSISYASFSYQFSFIWSWRSLKSRFCQH